MVSPRNLVPDVHKKLQIVKKKLIKLKKIRDNTYSSTDLVRYPHTDLNLSISSSVAMVQC